MKHGRSKPSRSASSAGQVRIIAGRMRGRRLSVPDVEGLRPTGDRVRETLFNWLQADVAGSHCLDLFAGSGALGFEALSRFAHSVTFVEPDPSASLNLAESCQLLEVHTSYTPTASMAGTAHLYAGTAQAAIEHWTGLAAIPSFDLVFIDPPFQMSCQWTILQTLVPQLLNKQAMIYIEAPSAQGMPEQLPEGCEMTRDKRFGDVTARLLSYTSLD